MGKRNINILVNYFIQIKVTTGHYHPIYICSKKKNPPPLVIHIGADMAVSSHSDSMIF